MKSQKYQLDKSFEKVNYSPVCVFCKHLLDIDKRKCKAFVTIPLEIWNGNNDHKKPYPNDNGYQFSKIEKKTHEKG